MIKKIIFIFFLLQCVVFAKDFQLDKESVYTYKNGIVYTVYKYSEATHKNNYIKLFFIPNDTELQNMASVVSIIPKKEYYNIERYLNYRHFLNDSSILQIQKKIEEEYNTSKIPQCPKDICITTLNGLYYENNSKDNDKVEIFVKNTSSKYELSKKITKLARANWQPLKTSKEYNTLIVNYSFDKYGKLLNANISQSTGNNEYDMSGIKAIESIFPIEIPPDIAIKTDYSEDSKIEYYSGNVVLSENTTIYEESFDKYKKVDIYYIESIKKKISKTLEKNNVQGTHKIYIQIGKNGELLNSIVYDHKNKDEINIILKCIKESSPFKPLPSYYPGEAFGRVLLIGSGNIIN